MRRHLLIGMTLWVALTAGCGSADPQPPSTEADSGASQTDAVTIDAVVDLGTEVDRPAVVDVPMDVSTDLGAAPDVDLAVDAAPVVDTGPACEGGQTTCGASCVDTAADPRHCGSCENDCTALVGVDPSAVRCSAGRCDLTGVCRSERGDCDGQSANGCETDLTLPASCGSCAASCGGATPICTMVAGDAGARRACSNGCTPLTPTRCDGTCVDTERDTSHCGACGQACVLPNATAACAGGRCTVERCRAGYLDCNGDSADGCEVDGQTAVANCGACARACPGTERGRAVCTAGSCGIVCDAGTHPCDGRCVRDDDPNTCGARCSACPAGPVGSRPVCLAGTCDFACEAGTHRCGSSCASDTSPASCGSSCTPCPSAANADATCETGRCGVRCRTGFADCDGNSANGCEADLSTASTCGACGVRCTGGTPFCSVGAGAERSCTNGCTSSAPTRCGSSCVNLQSDVAHCGACDAVCAPANASARCMGGRCALASCASGYLDCDGLPANGCEVRAADNPAHCGACGNACPSPANGVGICQGGSCGRQCSAGFHLCGERCVSDADVATCGARCVTCPTGPVGTVPACVAGACVLACDTGYHACGSACVSNMSIASCGTSCAPCSTPSNADSTCDGTTCGLACRPGFGNCDGLLVNGCEVTLSNNVLHCGACGRACASPAFATARCSSGACDFVCDEGFVRSGPSCAPVAPRLLSPLSTSRVTSRRPTLRWSLSVATTVSVRLCRDRALTRQCQSVSTDGDVFSPSGDLAPGVWFWRVERTAAGVTVSSFTWEFFVGQRSAPISVAIGSVPDFNGDGLADLAVGSYYGAPVGVYHGSSAGIERTPTRYLPAPAGSGYFSRGLGNAADVNGDGYGDLIVGASYYRQAFIYFGSPDGLGSTPQTLNRGSGDLQFYGESVSTAGDINADGYGDVLVGGNNGSSAYIYWGSPTGVGLTPTVLTGPSWALSYGRSVTGFDANGDGYSDVFVGAAPVYGNPAVFLYLGGPRGVSALPSVRRESYGTQFGATIECAGDVNADGYGDLIVGQPGQQAWFFRGNSTGIEDYPLILDAAPGYGLGSDVAGGLDVNGDGYSDVIAGGERASYVFLGRSTGLSSVPIAIVYGESGFGNAVSALGDVDGDGYGDFAVGSYRAAQVFVYLGAPSGLGPLLPTLQGPRDGTWYGSSLD